ncbi:SDR family NAD(P)-dependent oxidoreductase [Pseudarthrobacter sulfonivorans]|uniref:SDR family NAD(P)-dependent oxidoreductase n=1 Tax=Pseudarthrobacter sulfonivorans TaxID=121292 RepID=UPI002102C882|nr:SDR family NAD(P)-dependent oxidoreductase [Pseudarthrobacter sulfonivorans]
MTSQSATRVALVTGAGQGVGREVVHQLIRKGVASAVIVNDYVAEKAEAVAQDIRDIGGHAVAAAFDVGDHAQVAAVLQRATAEVGPIDILVNNAGNGGAGGATQDSAPFWESDPTEWQPWIDVNLTGVFNCTHTVLGGMVERGYGRVITVISDAGRVGEPNLVVYSAAKAGAAGFTRAIARAGGRHGVTANCVALGATRTPTTALDGLSSEDERRFLRNYTVKRFGLPEDAAAAIVFLASEEAGWITTQTLPVNGGYSSAL